MHKGRGDALALPSVQPAAERAQMQQKAAATAERGFVPSAEWHGSVRRSRPLAFS